MNFLYILSTTSTQQLLPAHKTIHVMPQTHLLYCSPKEEINKSYDFLCCGRNQGLVNLGKHRVSLMCFMSVVDSVIVPVVRNHCLSVTCLCSALADWKLVIICYSLTKK